jgi:hypothetical protein
MANVTRYFLALIMMACVVGCGGPYDASVSGVVMLDSKAVPCGTVTFNPIASGPAPLARIDEDGSYTVYTGRAEGLPSGEYQVTVTANEPPAMMQSPTGGPPPDGKPITPEWYRSKSTSGLRVNVTPGRNTIDLDLSTKPPTGWKSGGRS